MITGDIRDPGFDPWVRKKEIATHSYILAWKIPWIEEPGGLVHGFAKNRTQLSGGNQIEEEDSRLQKKLMSEPSL